MIFLLAFIIFMLLFNCYISIFPVDVYRYPHLHVNVCNFVSVHTGNEALGNLYKDY